MFSSETIRCVDNWYKSTQKSSNFWTIFRFHLEFKELHFACLKVLKGPSMIKEYKHIAMVNNIKQENNRNSILQCNPKLNFPFCQVCLD